MTTNVQQEQREGLVQPGQHQRHLRLVSATAGLLQHGELLLFAVAAATLIFLGRATALGLALLATDWLNRRVVTRRGSVATRVDRWVPSS
jgi:hypothetical protein